MHTPRKRTFSFFCAPATVTTIANNTALRPMAIECVNAANIYEKRKVQFIAHEFSIELAVVSLFLPVCAKEQTPSGVL